VQTEAHETTEKVFSVQYGKDSDWLGFRRQASKLIEHHECCFSINHWRCSKDHQLFMLDVVTEMNQGDETNSLMEEVKAIGNGEDQNLETTDGKQKLKRKIPRYYDMQQQLELVLAAQELSEFGDHELCHTDSDEKETYGINTRNVDIWKDTTCLGLLKEDKLPDTVDLEGSKRARKKISNYCWKEQRLYFKGLLVPKPEERMTLVIQMHEDLGHFGEQKTLAEICQTYSWHNRTKDVRIVVRMCQQCQLVRSMGSIRSEDEEMKSIPVCELFYRVALDTAGPLPETKTGNKYILVVVDHYSKWCEAKAVADHGAKTVAKFLENDVICKYGVPKFVLTDNGGEWAVEFDVMCKDYGIQHQHTAPQWPQCNGMVEHLIKTIKHGITILVATPKNIDYWDEHLAKVMFGYRCEIQASTKFSPFMILTGRTPRLRADNYLHALTAVTNDNVDVEVVVAQFLQKVKLITSIHENVLLNVEQAQKKQRKTYATKKGKQTFEGLVVGETMVKMKKPGKKRALTTS